MAAYLNYRNNADKPLNICKSKRFLFCFLFFHKYTGRLKPSPSLPFPYPPALFLYFVVYLLLYLSLAFSPAQL